MPMRLLALLLLATPAAAADWALALHGGAGVIERAATTPAEDAAIRAALGQALDAGSAILNAGGSATDAVAQTVRLLEDSAFFNAGVGAVFTSAGTIELDAAIMEGRFRRAGAVTGVKTTRSPVALAAALMAKGPPVFLAGPAADRYAVAAGLAQVPNSHFMTEGRRRQLDDLRARGQGAGLAPAMAFGTVGAVARDARGHVAAATSTGGLTGKMPGRVGDAPVIGAGTLADDRCGAVSATGSGEMFLRVRVAGQICDRARFGGQALAPAAEAALAEVADLGGSGGVILLGPAGDALFALNTPGMYRARASAKGPRQIAIYGDE